MFPMAAVARRPCYRTGRGTGRLGNGCGSVAEVARCGRSVGSRAPAGRVGSQLHVVACCSGTLQFTTKLDGGGCTPALFKVGALAGRGRREHNKSLSCILQH